MELAKRSETSHLHHRPAAAGRRPPKGFREAEFVLRQFAQETGGRVVLRAADRGAAGVYGQIADELSSQYTVGYASKNGKRDGAWRKIERPGVALQRDDPNPARLLRSVALESARASSRLHHRRRPRRPGPDQRARATRAPVGPGGYPRLAGQPSAARMAPAAAERIDVGGASPQPDEQDAINYLIAEKAREGRDGRPAEMGRPVRVRPRRLGSAVPARAGGAVRGGAWCAGRHRGARVRRHPDHLSGRRRHADVRPRPRGRGADAASRRLGEPRPAGRHDCLLCRAAADAADRQRIALEPRPRTPERRRRSCSTGRCRRSGRSQRTLEEIVGRVKRDPQTPRPACSSSAGGRGSASTCSGSTTARCSESASLVTRSPNRRRSWSNCSS